MTSQSSAFCDDRGVKFGVLMIVPIVATLTVTALTDVMDPFWRCVAAAGPVITVVVTSMLMARPSRPEIAVAAERHSSAVPAGNAVSLADICDAWVRERGDFHEGVTRLAIAEFNEEIDRQRRLAWQAGFDAGRARSPMKGLRFAVGHRTGTDRPFSPDKEQA